MENAQKILSYLADVELEKVNGMIDYVNEMVVTNGNENIIEDEEIVFFRSHKLFFGMKMPHTIRCDCHVCQFQVLAYSGDFVEDHIVVNDKIYNDLKSIIFRISRGSSKIEFMSHPVVHMLLNNKDGKLFVQLPVHIQRDFWYSAYELRRIYGSTRFYGYRTNHDDLVAQAPDGAGFTDFFRKIFEGTKAVGASLADFVKSTFETITSGLTHFVSFLGEHISKILNTMFNKLVKWFVKVLDPIGKIKNFATNTNIGRIVSVISLILILTVLVSAGILMYDLMKIAISFICSFLKNDKDDDDDLEFYSDHDLEGEGPQASALASVVGIFGLLFTFNSSEKKNLIDKLRYFTLLIASAGAFATLAGGIFLLLPVALQTVITQKFGSDQEKERVKIDEWITRSAALMKVSKIPHVIVSKEFSETLDVLIKEAHTMKLLIKDQVNKNIFSRQYFSLLSLQCNLTQFNNSSPTRPVPFSLHVFGIPGIGKTLLTDKVLRDAFDSIPNEVYTRPVSSEYWDGYIGQKIVFYDEFLVGNADQKSRAGLEYLELISSKRFTPPSASIDNVTVGIKGTEARPRVVMTLNNAHKTQVQGIDEQALSRRRDIVAEFVINPEYSYRFNGNRVNLSHGIKTDGTEYPEFTQEELAKAVWVKVRVHNTTHVLAPNGAVKDLIDFTMFIKLLREAYAHKEHISKTLVSALDPTNVGEKTPEEIIQDALREMQGIPNEPISFMTLMKQYFNDIKGVFSQGPKLPKKTRKNGRRNVFVGKSATSSKEEETPILVESHEPSTSNDVNNIDTESILEKATGDIPSSGDSSVDDNESIDFDTAGSGDEDHSSTVEVAPVQEVFNYVYTHNRFRPFSYHQGMCFSFGGLLKARSESIAARTAIDEFLKENIETMRPLWNNWLRRRIEDYGCPMLTSHLDHSNVFPFLKHRHNCKACGVQFTHAHDNLTHDIRCEGCIQLNKPNNFRHINSNFQELVVVDEEVIVTSLGTVETLPSMWDYDFPEFTETEAHELRLMWLRELCSTFGFFTRVFVDFRETNPNMGQVFILDETLFEHCWTGVKSIVKVGGVIILTYAVINFIKKLIKGEEYEPVCFAQSARPNKEQGSKNKAKNFKLVSQGSIKPMKFEVNGLLHNCVPIQGKSFLTYRHALYNGGSLIPDQTPAKLHWNGKIHDFKILHSLLKEVATDDLAFVTIPGSYKQIQTFPNNINKFWTLSEKEVFTQGTCYMLDGTDNRYSPIVKRGPRSYGVSQASSTERITITESLSYSMPTQAGDCGFMIVSTSAPCPGKYIGMHVCGSVSQPFGVAVTVTREDILNALVLDTADFDCDDLVPEGPEISDGPNLKELSLLPRGEQVNSPTKSKLKPSVLVSSFDFSPKKQPAILSVKDDRGNGENPLYNMINETIQVSQPDVDLNLINEVKETMISYYSDNLQWCVGKRRLTFEEACMGIPSHLSSLKVKTSSGWPLMKLSNRKGKTNWIWFDEMGKFHYNPIFKTMVLSFVEGLDNGFVDESRFVAYLKDELLSEEKIQANKTRVIYCGDLVATVGFRMVLGATLAAFNSSNCTTPSAIGLNPYSHDMNKIYDYLYQGSDSRFVAGDYKNFDKRHVRTIQNAAYEILGELSSSFTEKNVFDSFVEHQTEGSIMVGKYLIKLKTSHLSGCFFTTIINNLVNEFYFRIAFRCRFPELRFDDYVKCKFLGDDHILSLKEIDWNPLMIRDDMLKLNQIYTSDRKNEELTADYRRFEDITFLGAHPVIVNGFYSGALKKNTIEETLCWTRDEDVELDGKSVSMVELASQWDNDYFNYILQQVKSAYKDCGREFPLVTGYSDVRRMVAARTTESGLSFNLFAHSSDFELISQGPEKGLVQMESKATDVSVELSDRGTKYLATKALNEAVMDLNFGTESNIFRTQVEWTTLAEVGVPILQLASPFGILGLGDSNNVQNMPFDRYIYWVGDVEITAQINATPFDQGLLALYWVPLAQYPVESSNITFQDHVLLTPNANSTASLKIDFAYIRSTLNTFAVNESLGTFYLVPLAKLRNVNSTPVTVTIYSKFPGSKFTIPRPPPVESVFKTFYKADGSTRVVSFKREPTDLVAHGASYSTTHQNSVYNIESVAGDLSSQQTSSSSATQSTEADVSIPMPLDNPHLSSGAIPCYNQFNGLSKSVGVKPLVDLQLKPSTIARQQQEVFGVKDTQLRTILGKRCLLSRFTVATTTAVGAELYKIELNTRMGIDEGSNVPVNLVVLNHFVMWRSDIKFTFVPVKTGYHSGRLQVVTAYGSPSLEEASRHINKSVIVDIKPDSDQTSVVVNWNAQTEFLRTYSGEGVVDPVQNYSLGTLGVYVQNQLRAPETVVDTVEVLVFIEFIEPKVAVPRPLTPFTMNDFTRLLNPEDYFTFPNGIFIMRRQTTDGVNTFLYQPSGAPAPYGTYLPLAPTSITYVNGGVSYSNVVSEISVTPTGGIFYHLEVQQRPDIVDSFFTIEMSQNLFSGVSTLRAESSDLVSQGPDGEPLTNKDGTLIAMTSNEAPSRQDLACRSEPFQKNEFCPSDVTEIIRRYIRISNIPNLDKGFFIVNSTVTSSGSVVNYANVGVMPVHPFVNLYAAWAGSMCYRVVVLNRKMLRNVSFFPAFNVDPLNPGIPSIDAYNDSVFEYNGTQITGTSMVSTLSARETMFPLTDIDYIDVSTPFQSHLNCHLTSQTQVGLPVSSGTVSVSYTDELDPQNFLIFAAAGDDLRLGLLRAPRLTTFSLFGFEKGINGFY